MRKSATRRKSNHPKLSPTRQAALAERRELESGRNLQRKIRRLSRELERAVAQADDALISIVRLVHDRLDAREAPRGELEPAGV